MWIFISVLLGFGPSVTKNDSVAELGDENMYFFLRRSEGLGPYLEFSDIP